MGSPHDLESRPAQTQPVPTEPRSATFLEPAGSLAIGTPTRAVLLPPMPDRMVTLRSHRDELGSTGLLPVPKLGKPIVDDGNSGWNVVAPESPVRRDPANPFSSLERPSSPAAADRTTHPRRNSTEGGSTSDTQTTVLRLPHFVLRATKNSYPYDEAKHRLISTSLRAAPITDNPVASPAYFDSRAGRCASNGV